MFIYLRREGQVLIHSLLKYTVLVEDFASNHSVVFQGQDNADLNLNVSKELSSVKLNKAIKSGDYDASKKLIKLKIINNHANKII